VGTVHPIQQPDDFFGKGVAVIFNGQFDAGGRKVRAHRRDALRRILKAIHHPRVKAGSGQRPGAVQVEADLENVRPQKAGRFNGIPDLMLPADAVLPHIHGKIVFQKEAARPGGGADAADVSGIQTLQDGVVQLNPVEPQVRQTIEQFNRAQLPRPRQLESGPGLPQTVHVKTVGVNTQQHFRSPIRSTSGFDALN